MIRAFELRADQPGEPRRPRTLSPRLAAVPEPPPLPPPEQR
jgi:hypothetical protein